MNHKIVFTNGCFDILHKGHVELLKYCKTLGCKVIVGINSDKSVKRLKGNTRPISCQSDRKAVLESIKFVDEVFIFEEDTPYRLIKSINPDVIVKGGDYKKEDVVGSDLCEVKIFNFIDGYSTSSILDEILNGK